MPREIILASVSPRRLALMKLLRIKFKVVESGYRESVRGHLTHSELVKSLALGKAKAAAKKFPNAVVVAADTMLSFNGKVIGKPKNKKHAFNMLKSFCGKTQEVLTGVVVMDAAANKVLSTTVKSRIYFKNLSDGEILEYVNSGEALDKAGSYGPLGKGMSLINKVEGDYTSAIGLPMGFVVNALSKLKVKI